MSEALPAPPISGARAVGWAVVYLAAGFVLMLVFAGLGARFIPGVDTSNMAHLILLQSAGGLLAFGGMTWALGVRGLHLTLGELRYRPLTGAVPGFTLGILLGAAPAAFAVGLSLAAGGASFQPDSGSTGDYLRSVAVTTLLLAPAALVEELMFRGVGQVLLARVFGRVRAVLALSGVFALAHVLNPNTTALGLVNIALAGVFLGAAFYAPGGLWTAWGAHLGWNATLAAMDAPVSGLPFPIPLIDYQPGGPLWLTGGTFGPEGGLVATAGIILATAAAWRWGRKEQPA